MFLSGQPTIKEKALLLVETLDLGLSLPTTTGRPPTSETVVLVAGDDALVQVTSQAENTSNASTANPKPENQRKKRQMQHCPIDTYKICQDIYNSKLIPC